MPRPAASRSSGGPSLSGKPWPRLTDPVATASALISAKIVVPNSRIRSTRKGVRGVGGMSGRLRPMNREALLLTLAAALLHASWNFAAKRAEGGGPVFVWGYAAA